MPITIDPIGESRRRYKKKILEARKKGKKLSYYDIVTIKDGKYVKYKIPIIPIYNLEYGPRKENEGSQEYGEYPYAGQGAPGIGAGPGQPGGQPGGDEHCGGCPGGGGQPGGQPGDQPGPGSGVPGTPLYPPPGADGPWAGEEIIDPIYGETEEEELLKIMEGELELEMIKPGKHKRLKKITYPAISHRGDDSLLDLDQTIESMFERQLVESPVYSKLEKELLEKIKNKKKEREQKRDYINKLDLEETEKEKKIYETETRYSKSINALERRLKDVRRRLEDIKPEPGEGMKMRVEEEDLKYLFPKMKYKNEKDAIVIYIRDVSGSITEEHLKASYKFTRLIDLWLEKCYPHVEKVYIAHNYDAWEETPEGYKQLQSGGGTKFESAYDIVLSMFWGDDYPTKMEETRKIKPNLYDIYIVQMTDGFGQRNEEESEFLIDIMPELTRFCYLEERIDYGGYEQGYKKHLEERFSDEYNTGKLRTFVISDMKNLWGAMKAFFGKGGS